MTPPRPDLRRFRWILAAWIVACLAAVAWIGARLVDEWRLRRGTAVVADAPGAVEGSDAPEEIWSGRPQYVVDPVVGWRPRRNADVPLRVAPLGGEATRTRRHHDGLGLIREGDGSDLGGPPRALLVGDSHLMGVVPNAENASDVLERRLRSEHGLERASVLNGSAGFYSLWQEVLRARTLAPKLAPRLLILAVFLGNDFVELEDLGRPHLDDELAERPADAAPPPETTSERLADLALAGDAQQLFWQGLNQACYFEQHPDRLEPVLAKARRCVELAQELARERDLRLLVALVPSYDLVFPERVKPLGARVAAVVDHGANASLRERFLALLAERSIGSVDLVAAFQTDGRDALYATDYHLHTEGHRLLAEALFAPCAAALR